MPRIQAIESASAQGKAKDLLDAVQKKMGRVPNIAKTMANSPAVLEAYLGFSGALAATGLSAKTREQIALAVAEINGCAYCLSAHTAIGAKLGLNSSELDAARKGESVDSHTQAILTLARELIVTHGRVRDTDLRAARAAGVSDSEITEVVAVVALNIFTNYFNHVCEPTIDFPIVEPASVGSHGSSCSTGSCKE